MANEITADTPQSHNNTLSAPTSNHTTATTTTTTINTNTYSPQSPSPPKNTTIGLWLGIDLGTTNSAIATWDTSKNRAKLIRLSIATPQHPKKGRIVPSAVFYTNDNDEKINVKVGQHAITMVESSPTITCCSNDDDDDDDDNTTTTTNHSHRLSSALVRSTKRLFGLRPEDLTEELRQSLPYEITTIDDDDDDDDDSKKNNGERMTTPLLIRVDPYNTTTHSSSSPPLHVTPFDISVILLRSILAAALETLAHSSNHYHPLGGDDSSVVVDAKTIPTNVVIGTPAHFSHLQKNLLIQAARKAGITGHISTLAESTAAVLAYGLNIGAAAAETTTTATRRRRRRMVVVLDVGGGTSDVTVGVLEDADTDEEEEEEERWTVMATGGRAVGGDDVDRLLMEWVVSSSSSSSSSSLRDGGGTKWTKGERAALLQRCREAKEQLSSETTVSITLRGDGTTVTVSRDDFESAIIRPFLEDIRSLLEETTTTLSSSSVVDEVVLVGGGTVVPSLRRLVRDMFPSVPDLCTSIHPHHAVAQGLAIKAAGLSRLVPKHELRSAMMLDALPYGMGVKKVGGAGDDDGYVEILKKFQGLPARGCERFVLADVRQRGVSVTIVEDVGGGRLEMVGEFTFLLRRLEEEELKVLEGGAEGVRAVDVGLMVDESGKVVVSIFDEHDPEHVEKRRRWREKQQQQSQETESNDEVMAVKGSSVQREEIFLTFGCVVMFVLYVLARLAFHVPDGTAQIL